MPDDSATIVTFRQLISRVIQPVSPVQFLQQILVLPP